MAFNCFARDIAKRIPRGETENAPAARCSAHVDVCARSSPRVIFPPTRRAPVSISRFSTRKAPFLLPQSIPMKILALARSLNPFSALLRLSMLGFGHSAAFSRVQPRSAAFNLCTVVTVVRRSFSLFDRYRSRRNERAGIYNTRDLRRSGFPVQRARLRKIRAESRRIRRSPLFPLLASCTLTRTDLHTIVTPPVGTRLLAWLVFSTINDTHALLRSARDDPRLILASRHTLLHVRACCIA